MTDSNKGLRILIIDDNYRDQFLITELLSASVIRIQLITTTGTLGNATDILQKETFDIILLDLTLPDSSGIETFKAVKKHAGKMPVIILSGITDMNIAVEAISLGAQDYQIKGDLDEKTLTKTILYSIERKHKLENLRESNERYITLSKAELDLMQSGEITRQIMNGALDAIVCIDAYGKINVWNPQAEKIFGWKQNEILGRTLTETIIPGGYHEKHAEALKLYLSTGQGSILNKLIEITAVNCEGKHFPIELTVIPLSENGNRFFCAFIRDISDRKRAQEKGSKIFEQQKILEELIKAVSRVQKPEEIYELTLNGLQEAIGADKASVLLFDDNDIMRFVASRNLSNTYKEATAGHSPWKAGEKEAMPIFIPDVSKEPSFQNLLHAITEEGICALGFIPLIHQQQLLGKFMVYYTSVHHFTEEEIQLVQNIASNIAFAIWEKKSAIALKESEEKYRSLVEHAGDVILIYSFDGTIHEFNNSALTFSGYSREEFAKLKLNDIVVGDLIQNPEKYNSILKGDVVTLYRKFKRKDGVIIELEITVKMLGDGKVLAFGRDITERKKAEDKIRESEMKYRTLMQQAGDSILLFTGSGQLVEANESARQLLGYSMEEYKKMSLKDLFFEEDIKKKPFRFDLLNKGESTVNRRRLKRKGGTVLETEIHAKKLSDGRYLGVARDLTERIKAEQQLRESEEKYRTLVEHASDGIVISGINGICIDANSTICNMLGYTKEELSSRNLFDLVIINKKDVPFGISEVLAGRTVLQEREVIKKDGTFLPVELNSKLLPDNRLLIIVRDISERRKIEDALRQSNERNEIVAKATSDVIWDWDLLTGKVYRSKEGLKKVYGLDNNSPIELVKNWNQRVHPDDREMMRILIEKIHESVDQNTFSVEYRFLGGDGQYVNVFDRGYIIRNEHGKPVRMIGAAQNITERKIAEEELRQSNERFEMVAKATNDAVWDWNLLTNETWGNESLYQLYDLNPQKDKLSDVGFYTRIHPEDMGSLKESLKNAFEKSDQLIVDEYRFRKGDGTYRTIVDRAYIQYDEAGKPVRILGAMQDITERKKAEDEIKRQNEQYDDLVKNIPVGVYKFRMKPDGKMTLDYISPRLSKMIGVKETDAYQDIMNTFKVIHPDDFGSFLKLIEESYSTKQKFLWEGRTIVDGQKNWVKIESSPKVLKNGDTLWDGVIADITERKKTEEIIRNNEIRLTKAQQIGKLGYWQQDVNSNMIWGSEEAKKIYGFPPVAGELASETIAACIPDFARVRQAAIELLKYDKKYDIEFLINPADGSPARYISAVSEIEKNEQGVPLRFMGVLRDITERKNAEEEILKTNARFQMLSKATSDIVWDYNLTDGTVWWNDNYYSLIGIRKEKELTHRNEWYSRIHPDDIKRVRENAKKMIQSNDTSWSDEYRFAKTDGTYLHFLDRGYVMRNQDGKPYRMVGSMVNMTPVYAAQKEVAESENRLRTIFESEPECIKLLGPKGELLDMNPAGLAMIEADNLEMVRDNPVLGIITPSYRKAFDKLTKDVFKGKSGILEFEITGLKGTHRWLETHAVPMRDAAGTVTALLGVTRNITERKKAEQELKESEAKYRTLVEQAVDAIALYDAAGKILDVNTGSVNLLGYTKKELIQMYLSDVLTKEEIQTRPVQYDVLQKGESTVKQRMMRRKDGSIVQTEVRSQQLPDGRFLSVIRDLTERAKAQEQIEKEKELSDSIINSLPGVFYLQDYTSKYLRWNKKFETVTEYNAGEISKLNPLDFFAGDEKKAIINKIGEVLAKGSSYIETVIITKSGKRIPYYLTGQLIQYEGKPCFIGVGVDITDRKKAEQELQESYKAIRKLTEHLQNIREEERANMAREIHDELGQQLTVMKMDISWINKRIGVKEESVKARIKQLLLMLDGTVQSVRRISSELRPSLLDDLGLTAAMEWQLTEFEKRFEIKTHFKPDDAEIKLPESMKTALFRIFQESLTNVARHSKAKKVTVTLHMENGSIVLSVADDGVGFDKQNTIGKKTLGILGMQERTSMMGGAYEISGNPGKGTRVVVTIPLGESNKN